MPAQSPNDARWRAFVLASAEPLLLLDASGTAQCVNAAAAQWLRIAPPEAGGRSLGGLGLSCAAAGPLPDPSTLAAEPSWPVTGPGSAGQRCTADLQVLPLDGQPACAYLARLQPHVAPVPSELSAQLLASVPDLLAICDRQGRSLYYNPAWSAALGLLPDELQARHFLDFVHPDDRDAAAQVWAQLQTQAGHYRLEHRFLCRDRSSEGLGDRSYRWLQWHLTAAPAQGAIYLSGCDITGRKQAEAAATLSELREHQKARQLGQTLMHLKHREQQLVQAMPPLLLGRLTDSIATAQHLAASNLVHNLHFSRDYLLNLLNLLQLYRQHLPEASAALREAEAALDFDFIARDLPALLASASTTAAQLNQLIAVQLDFAQGQPAESLQSVDLLAELERALLLLQHRCRTLCSQGAIAIRRRYDELPLLQGYPHQLRQMFLYLLDNALEAIAERYASDPPAEPPSLELAAATVESGEGVEIAIADNGCGMTEAVSERASDLFFTTRPGRGLGLGLPLSRQIIAQRHGGHLRYTTQLGIGTTLRVTLPVRPTAPNLNDHPPVPGQCYE